MKVIHVIIERNEDAFFAYAKEIDGITAGGGSYEEVKANIEFFINLALEEDKTLAERFRKGYMLVFQVDLESVFKLLPELNVTTLARHADLNPGLLRQYASGTKKASEKQAEKVSRAIAGLADKLNSFKLVGG